MSLVTPKLVDVPRNVHLDVRDIAARSTVTCFLMVKIVRANVLVVTIAVDAILATENMNATRDIRGPSAIKSALKENMAFNALNTVHVVTVNAHTTQVYDIESI